MISTDKTINACGTRAACASYGLLALEPIDCCGEAEHAHEG
jgi:hypothetical protein